MTTLVCFRAGGTRYAIPVSSTLGVRPASSVVAVPGAHDVVGVLPGDPVLNVIAPLHVDGNPMHVLVVTTSERDFGLLVDAVTEVLSIDDADIRPATDAGAVVGVAEGPDGIVLVTDPLVLGRRP